MNFRRLMLLGCVFVGALAVAGAPGPSLKSPAGWKMVLSECASGGFDYTFFDGGTVISSCWGCEAQPDVEQGNWKVVGDTVEVTMDREWMAVGQGRVIEKASIDVYETYAAVAGPSTSKEKLVLKNFVEKNSDSCSYARRHTEQPDHHAYLRTEYASKYPWTSERAVTDADLKGLKPAELRLMRNEIYARYGLKFESADLKAVFDNNKTRRRSLTNVDAFMSDLEKANVERIQRAEGKDGGR